MILANDNEPTVPTLREQIKQLIAEIREERQECMEITQHHPDLAYANHEFLLGKRVSLDWASDRLEAILAQCSPENASEALKTSNTGMYDDGYDAGFQAAMGEMRIL